MVAILVYMASLLLISEITIVLLMALEKNARMFTLQESPKKKEDLFVFMRKRNMALMMEILSLSVKSEE